MEETPQPAMAQFRKALRRDTHPLLRRHVVHEGGDALSAGSGDGVAVAAPGLVGPGLGTLRRGRHPRFPRVLRTVNGVPIATGDLLQVNRGRQVESRMVFRFKDGSVYDETVMFTQERVFTMQSYRLVQRGPVFTEDTEISLERASAKYRVSTKSHKDGREQVLNGTIDLPPDVYNGMVITVAKNLPKGASEPSIGSLYAHAAPDSIGVCTGGRA